MKKFPVTIVDDFFETPEVIRQYALNQDYIKADSGNWPGLRSDHIGNINPELFDVFCKKLLGLFFNFNNSTISWEIEATFQRVPDYGKLKYENMSQGWIHPDDDSFFSGVVYLNKNFPPNTGTSIYSPVCENLEMHLEEKRKYYTGQYISDEDYSKALEKNNSQFVETVKVENVFNRLVLFEGGEYHGVPSFYSGTGEDRLTLVFYAHCLSINGDALPIRRSRNFL